MTILAADRQIEECGALKLTIGVCYRPRTSARQKIQPAVMGRLNPKSTTS